MKQGLAVLLCLLLLTACSKRPADSGSTKEGSKAEASSHSTETLHIQMESTQELVSQTSEAQSLEPAPVDASWLTGAKTAGGFRVHTDLSGYRPYQPIQSLYTRLRAGALDTFVPSEDYGAVYPYVASWTYTFYGWRGGATYGLVDAQGRILTDGIYKNISPLVIDDDTEGRRFVVYDDTGEACGAFWCVSIRSDSESQELWGIISMDGRMMLPCEWETISATQGGLICYCEDASSFSVYDFNGELMFRSEDVLDVGELYSVSYGEGFFLAQCYDRDRNLLECWFLNERGEKVFDLYAQASAFHEGLACVRQDGSHFGYIDKSGDWVIEPQYYIAYGDFSDGLAIQKNERYCDIVLDRTGAVKLSALSTNHYVHPAPCGLCATTYYDTGEYTTYYDREGRLLCSDKNLHCLDADTFYEQDQGKLWRLNGQELILSGAYEKWEAGKMVIDGSLRAGYIMREDYESLEGIFVPRDLSEPVAFRNPRLNKDDLSHVDYYSYYKHMDTVLYGMQDPCTEERWYFDWTGSEWKAMTEDGRHLKLPKSVRKLLDTLQIYGDRVLVQDDTACQYYDLEGNLIFSYPLDAGD